MDKVFSQGRLIAFSGLDSSGKSTQIDKLIDSLNNEGKQTVYLWTRGGYTYLFLLLKKTLRFVLKRKLPTSGHSEHREKMFRNNFTKSIWLTIAVLDLILVYGVQIRWWLWQGKYVICDRYIWDTQIDFKLNLRVIDFRNWWLWRLLEFITPQPNSSFLLVIPVQESLQRSKLKQEPFPNTEDELTARLKEYTKLANKGYWVVIDGKKPVQEIHTEISKAI